MGLSFRKDKEYLTQTLPELYLSGVRVADIADQLGVKRDKVYNWLSRLGVRRGPSAAGQPISKDELSEWAELYLAGYSSNDIAEKFNRPDGGIVRKHLRKMSIIRPIGDAINLAVKKGKIRKYRFNEAFFDTITPDSAWVLGVLFGDGWVTKVDGDKYSVGFSGAQDVLIKINKLIGHDGPVVQCVDYGVILNCWNINICSKYMVNTIERDFEICGHKSHTMKMPSLPAGTISHFIRGLMDSDGGWELRGNCLRSNYTTASLAFAVALRSILFNIGIDSILYKYEQIYDDTAYVSYRIHMLAKDTAMLADYVYTGSRSGTRSDFKFEVAVNKDISGKKSRQPNGRIHQKAIRLINTRIYGS